MILTDEEILSAMTPDAVEGDYYLPQAFARAIEAAVLAKLAVQGVVPFAVVHETRGGWYQPTPKVNEDGAFAIYTEPQLIAAQQRTAEACAKYLQSRSNKMSASESRNKFGVQVGAASLDSAAKRIRNGEWREYL